MYALCHLLLACRHLSPFDRFQLSLSPAKSFGDERRTICSFPEYRLQCIDLLVKGSTVLPRMGPRRKGRFTHAANHPSLTRMTSSSRKQSVLFLLGFSPEQIPHRGEQFRSVDSEQIERSRDTLRREAAIRKTLSNLRSVSEVLGPIDLARVCISNAFSIVGVDQERHFTRVADLYVPQIGDDQ